MKSKAIFSLALAAPAAALAQAPQQVVRPPIAQYWMSVETGAGMSMPGMGGLGSMMSGMMGGGQQSGRKMYLQLGSQQANPSPSAEHAIPAGLDMGPALPLVTPARPKPEPRAREDGMPENYEPKGRMLIYWGCGEAVRAGQPLIIDFAKMSAGQAPRMTSRRVSIPNPPRGKTYGEWPNEKDGKAVPASASLRGDHLVKGNYSPEIRFALGEAHDFMEPVALTSSGTTVRWKAIPHATGYFATLFGSAQQDEVVMWSSSEVQEMGGMLMSYVPPGEVARLVREKVVLAPSVTECIVPAEVAKKAGGAPYFNFIAYGPEANFVHPPRPSDPKVPWQQEWTAKARFKSTGALMLGDAAGGRDSAAQRDAAPPASQGEASQSTQREAPAAPDPVQEGIKALRGIFGR